MSETVSRLRRAHSRETGVSVVIPAHNAANTLAATLESVLAQNYTNWEAIVVDDGSSDGTTTLARHYARLDARIRVRRQKRGGEAAARNRGIAQARNAWLLFLDADDTIAPEHMQRLMGALATDARLDAAYCDWVRVAPDGTRGDTESAPEPDALFAVAARSCPFAIHTCIVRRRLVEEIGCFDTSLSTCPDWDLWQRVARTGRNVVHIAEPLALYWMRAASAGGRALQVLTDGWTVIDRGHRADPRVRQPHPQFTHGADAVHRDAAKTALLCWVAGLLIGQGSRAEFLVFRLHDLERPRVDAADVLSMLILAPLLPGCHTSSAWPALWTTLQPRIRDFLDGLERELAVPGLAVDVEQRLRARVQPVRVAIDRPAGPDSSRQGVRTTSRRPSPGGVILLYHRVTNLVSDPWQLSVTPRHFAEQLDVLGTWARIVPLSELASAAETPSGGRRLAAITFDDGYADNLYDAVPILRRKDLPATVFVVASDEPRPDDFWWDDLSHLILECPLPGNLELEFEDGTIRFPAIPSPSVAAAAQDSQWRRWRAWEPAMTDAQRLYVDLWTRLCRLEASARNEVIDELYARCREERKPRDRNRRLTHAELARLATSGVEIGAHSVQHPSLALLSRSAQDAEIRESRRILEAVTGSPVVSFSYPFGSSADYTSETKELVQIAGFNSACSGQDGLVTPRSDAFELPRLHVPDLDGSAFEAWLLHKLARVAAA